VTSTATEALADLAETRLLVNNRSWNLSSATSSCEDGAECRNEADKPFFSPPTSSIAATTSLTSSTMVTSSFLCGGGKCAFALSTFKRSEFNKLRKTWSIWAWEGRRPASRAPATSAILSVYRAAVSSRFRGPDLGSRGSLSGDSSLLQQEEQAPIARRMRAVRTRGLGPSLRGVPRDMYVSRSWMTINDLSHDVNLIGAPIFQVRTCRKVKQRKSHT